MHPVTALYSLAFGEAEAVSVEQRKALHRRLGLPLDRPLLRTANALSPGLALLTADDSAAARLAGAKRLQNVHIGLPPSGSKPAPNLETAVVECMHLFNA